MDLTWTDFGGLCFSVLYSPSFPKFLEDSLPTDNKINFNSNKIKNQKQSIMNKLLLSGISLCLATNIFAQTDVVNIKDKVASKDEPITSYYLPKTVLDIEVEVVHNVFKAGPYASDSKKFFGIYANMKDEESWEIKGIKVKQHSEPDGNHHYNVYAPNGSYASCVALTDNGILRGINLPLSFSQNKVEMGKCEGRKKCEKKHKCCEMNDGLGKCKNMQKNHKMKTKKSYSSDFINNYLYTESDSVPKVGGAQFAYNRINSLRMTYNDILNQNSDAITSDLSTFLNEIKRQEFELNALFFGKSNQEKIEKTISFYPDKEATNLDLFQFSTKGGFEESGDDITISIKRKPTTMNMPSRGEKSGFVYRVPVLADIEIMQGKNVLWTGVVEIAQLGNTEKLPAGFFEKNDYKAVFDINTGALLQLSKQ